MFVLLFTYIYTCIGICSNVFIPKFIYFTRVCMYVLVFARLTFMFVAINTQAGVPVLQAGICTNAVFRSVRLTAAHTLQTSTDPARLASRGLWLQLVSNFAALAISTMKQRHLVAHRTTAGFLIPSLACPVCDKEQSQK